MLSLSYTAAVSDPADEHDIHRDCHPEPQRRVSAYAQERCFAQGAPTDRRDNSSTFLVFWPDHVLYIAAPGCIVEVALQSLPIL